MDSLLQSLAIVHSGQSSPDQINQANHKLLAFRNRPDAVALCLQLLASEQCTDVSVLHFAASSICDLIDTGSYSASSSPRVLLSVLCNRFDRPRNAPLALALQRAVGRLIVSSLNSSSSLLSDCLSLLSSSPSSSLHLFGVLERAAEFVDRLLAGKAAALAVVQMQHSASSVCSLVSSSGGLSCGALACLAAWVRLGAVPIEVLIPSGLIERMVTALSRADLAEAALQALSEVFAAPVIASFRSARSVARTTLSLDVPQQRALVLQVTKELLRLGASGGEHAHFRSSVAWAALLCDIVRQHPSLLVQLRDPLIDFLLGLLANQSSIELASQCLPVWVRLEEVASASSAEELASWRPLFARVFQLALKSFAANHWPADMDEDSLRQWRVQLEELVLSCGQVIGLDTFFAELPRVPLEVALWAAASVQVLHDGRTPYCIHSLFETLLGLPRPLPASVAVAACCAVSSYRGFLRQYQSGRMVSSVAQFCGSCLAVAPNAAAKALLDLSQTCGNQFAPDLYSIAPFVMRALSQMDAETMVLLLSMCGELASNLDERKAAPIVAEMLDRILSVTLSAATNDDQRAALCAALVGFCERSDGKCGDVYASFLERSWGRFPELALKSDEVCDAITALAVAAGFAGREVLPALASLVLRIMGHRRLSSGAVILMLKAFVVCNECPPSLVSCFAETVSQLCGLFHLRQEAADPDSLAALFDVAKRAQWNPVWREALARTIVNQRVLELLHLCQKHHGSNFKLASEVCAYQEALFQQSGPSSMGLIAAAAPSLASLHLREAVQGNPMALRFHSGPLYDLLKLVPGDSALVSLLQASLAGVVPAPKVIGTTNLLVRALHTSDNDFKNVLVDLQLVYRGRPDPEFMKMFAEL